MPTNQHLLRFPSTSAGFEAAARDLRALLDTRPLGVEPRYHVELAFEEIATNIVRHGSSTEDIEVTIDFGEDEVVLTFEDNGVPFDPRELPEPVPPPSIDDAQSGGLGLVLVRKISKRLSYERTPQCRNNLTVAIPTR
jgi:anti-sigma regulatory factor (Ser/Thr protein kinase)